MVGYSPDELVGKLPYALLVAGPDRTDHVSALAQHGGAGAAGGYESAGATVMGGRDGMVYEAPLVDPVASK